MVLTQTKIDMKITRFDSKNTLEPTKRQEIAHFLFTYLEQYTDPESDILRAINYALSDAPGKGGFLLVGYQDAQVVGAVVVNCTGMERYIPENILVYVATRRELRGQGLGRALVTHAVEQAQGSMALHVEADNPALALYQKIGFQNKYLEMRLLKH